MPIGTAAAETSVKVHNLSVPAEESQLSKVRDFIAGCCEEAGFSTRETNNTKLAVDEACTNVIKHAYKDVVGNIDIEVRVSPGNVWVKIFDTGERFDFASVKDPDLDQYVETGKKGGLGVFLINRLMDDVQYRAGHAGNELVMRKASHGAISRSLPGRIAWRGTLRYKFTLRASLGLLALIAAIWAFVFVRQTQSIDEQRTTRWLEKRRLAENLADLSRGPLLKSDPFSFEKTKLTQDIGRILGGNSDLAYVKVVDSGGKIFSSGDPQEMFSDYQPVGGVELMPGKGRVVWRQFEQDGRPVRDIEYRVELRNGNAEEALALGSVHLGVWQDEIDKSLFDPRFVTSLILFGIFLIGVLLIAALVSVFVKPIQVLTDGVRAIGQGSLDAKISEEGPAEIGAIAAVFNEIQERYKKAQVGVLEREKLQKEIEVAKQIQQALLPKRHPNVSGYDIAPYYQAAKDVGGDYYDFVQVDEDTLGVVVADVSGKGVPGSLVMTMIRTALRMEARGNKNASDVMAKMNDFVTDDMKKGMFVTIFYVILDSTNRIISFASAGHNPMILYRAESNKTISLKPKGFPVGISLPDETLFKKTIGLEKIRLKKDDMLVIYTDGVTEAMNEKREQFGMDRLIATIKAYGHLHPADFIEALEGEIKAFTGGNPQNDDITVVAIKEKLTADDVLSGLRKRLIEMVDVEGMSVKEACSTMKVSPATYYRYKKRVEVMGERGLKNKVLREDDELKRVSTEESKEIIEIIKRNPDYGAKRITEEFNARKDPSDHLTERMVYDELKRLGLNTKELRIEYLKRYKVYDEGEPIAKEKRLSTVEDLLEEVSSAGTEYAETPGGGAGEAPDGPRTIDYEFEDSVLGLSRSDGEGADAAGRFVEHEETELVGDLEISVVRGGDDIEILRIDGHLDSVSTGALEHKMNDVISRGALRIIVDLSRVSYISSGGWGILAGEVKRLREKKGDVVLAGMVPEVYDVYELLGFSDLITAFSDAEAARRHLAGARVEADAGDHAPVSEAPPLAREAEARPFTAMVKTDTYREEWDSLRIEAGTVGEKGDVVVLSLAGIVDTVSAENLRHGVDRVIKNGINKIVIDMSLVEYVSSGGWGTFTERLREVRRKGGDIKIFGMDPDVYYVFTMLGFNIVLSSFDILTEAIEDFKRSAGEKPAEHTASRPMPAEGRPAPPLAEEPARQADEAPRIPPAPAVEPAPHGGERAGNGPKPRRFEMPPLRKDEWAQWKESDGVLVGALVGPIEAVAVERLDRELDGRLESRPVYVVLDLGAVDYISSTGWGLVAKYQERLYAWGGAMALCGMSPDLHEIFGYLELNAIIRAYATLEDALEAFGKRALPPVAGSKHADASEAFPQDAEAVDEVLDAAAAERPDDVPAGTPAGVSLWTPDDLDILDEPQGGAAAAPEEASEEGEDGFADLSSDADVRRIDVEAIAREGEIAKDKKLRRIGWEEYGRRLRGIRNKTEEDTTEGGGKA